MYLLLDSNKRVKEIIPDINPIFPGVSIHDRYSSEFIERLIHVDDDTPIQEGYKLNEDTDVWEYVDPPVSEEVSSPKDELEQRLASIEERLAESDEIAIELYEANLAQEAINAEQDEAIIEIYEAMEVMNNG